jgi:Cytochrome C assembly protein
MEEFRRSNRPRWDWNQMRDKVAYSLVTFAAAIMMRNLYPIFRVVPDEASQGMIYRLLYFHVPAWWTAFLAVALSGVFSALYLIKKDLRYDAIAVSVTEVAVVFLIMGITLGSIWARIILGDLVDMGSAADIRADLRPALFQLLDVAPFTGGPSAKSAGLGCVLAMRFYRCADRLVFDPLVAHPTPATYAAAAGDVARPPVELVRICSAHCRADANPA